MWNNFVKDYFNFTRKERTGVILLTALVLILLVIPYCYPLFNRENVFEDSNFEHEIAFLGLSERDSLNRNTNITGPDGFEKYSGEDEENDGTTGSEVFYFDPNSASSVDWKRLGIKNKTIRTIQNYLSKGGRFYKAEDIRKIWGLSQAEAGRLIPFVRINRPHAPFASPDKREYPQKENSLKLPSMQPVDINLADTSSFTELPGIGKKLSARIVAFREKLGGFYSIDQVRETYQLPDSTFQKIRRWLVITGTPLQRININAASVNRMRMHPYLSYQLSRAIYEYRQQHGNFRSVEDIKKIMLVTDEMYRKVSPYLAVE